MEPWPHTAALSWGSGQWYSCCTLPHCLGAVHSGTPTKQCQTALGQWAVELLQNTATLPGGSGQWGPCHTLPHYLGLVGNGAPAALCHTALGQCVVELLPHIAALSWGSGQWNSCKTPPHCLGAVGGGTLATHYRTVWGNGQRSTSCTLPHCLGAMRSGTPATGGQNQRWPTSGQGGYITPAAWGVPTASKRGIESEVAHKWARWLHNPCHLGGPHRFRPGARIISGSQVGKVAT